MFKLMVVNTSWVSRKTILNYLTKIANLTTNNDTFSREVLIKDEKIGAALHKVRANLKFFNDLELIYKTNGNYTIMQEQDVKSLFQCLRQNKQKEINTYLKKWLYQLPFFSSIFDEFFIDGETKTTREFRDFLKRKDKNSKKPHYYDYSARFFAKFLDMVEVLEYQPRAQTLKIIDDAIIKATTTTSVVFDGKESNSIEMGIFYHNKKIPLPKNVFVKLVNNNNIPEEEREKIILDLL